MYDNNLNYGSSYDAGASSSTDVGAMVGIVIAAIVILLVLYVVSALCLGKIFQKAGVPAWKAWVPVYNQWTFLELGGQHGWISLLSLATIIPVVGFIGVIVAAVFSCVAAYRIGINFGKDGSFVLVYILLGLIWMIWLALDKSAVWLPAASAPTNNSVPPTTPPQPPFSSPDQPAAM